MPEIKSLEEFLSMLESWKGRPGDAVYPRIEAHNPYGDNTIGMAFDTGWWSALKYAKEHGWFSEN